MPEIARVLRGAQLRIALRTYQGLTELQPPAFFASRVVLVPIDDGVFWKVQHGQQPIDRGYLAKLVRRVIQEDTKPAVIGLDVDLTEPSKDVESKEDDDLRKAIREANDHGVRVVIAVPIIGQHSNYSLLPNIIIQKTGAIKDCSLKLTNICTQIGFVDPFPEDVLRIPNVENVPVDDREQQEITSYPLTLAESASPSDESLESHEKNEEHINGMFIAGEFPTIPAEELVNNSSIATNACKGRVVLIGRKWHEFDGKGPAVDQVISPSGNISELELQANYTESLLQHRHPRSWNEWLAWLIGILVDGVVGLTIFVAFKHARHWPWYGRVLVLILALLVPVGIASVLLFFGDHYMDFLLPLELYAIHIAFSLLDGTAEKPNTMPEYIRPVKSLRDGA